MTLTTRLTLLLLAVFVTLCAVLLHQSARIADRYFQSVTQELSAPIAMYIAQHRPPFRDGAFDAAQFRELARTAMILNPSTEVYALDAAGRILAYGEGARRPERNRVDLSPLRQFIAGADNLPLAGDDPRDATARRIFSVAAVGPPERPWGYVYVILDGGRRQAITAQVWADEVPAFAGGGIAAILLAGFVVAALLFGRLALPLRSLARAVGEFEEEVAARGGDQRLAERDEIARLRLGFQRLRSRIAAQMQALRRADTSRREWIAHLSHDLRTPLATLQALLETVLRRDGSASTSERREQIARALLHCTQIRRLLAELFESARLEAPTLELHTERFALGELAQDAALALREGAEAKGVRIECDIDASDTAVNADIGLFQRLTDNLLTNAVNASQRGAVVGLGVHRAGGSLVLSVRNSGAPATDMIRVFNDAREPLFGTPGLGLRIIAQILRLHGLRSRVDATDAAGTLIRIWIPAVTDDPKARPVLAR